RQELVARDAEHQDAGHQQRRTDRPPDEGLGNIHCAACWPRSACCGAPTFALAPSVNRYWPSVTTRSPALSPRAITATPSWVAATSTARRCATSPSPRT